MWSLAQRRYRYPGARLCLPCSRPATLTSPCDVELMIGGRLIRLTFDPSDQGDVASLFENFIELEIAEHFLKSIKHAVCFGAHIGTFVLALLARNPGCQIVALEPNPRNFQLLQQNLAQNGFQANLLPYAFGAFCGESWFTCDVSNDGHLITSPDAKATNLMRVETVNVDFFAQEFFRNLEFVEMDIEGAEWLVLPHLLDRLSSGCRVFFEAHNIASHQRQLDAILSSRRTTFCQEKRVGPHGLVFLVLS
ncbi:MAG: FkbM family methyltransferase [Candidatus Sumerlaeaceae bacterium]|nr:FkbM family methyltransferase [Candidatus Sumerlaeaceae bacterium]